ncbi:peptidase M23 [Streptomyces sp. NPDC052023]|uniref:peptidase M23 n=1 Tax=Streptomyces sp. NPDC052023 TaxID=3365681 RepID=UPI0037D56D38
MSTGRLVRAMTATALAAGLLTLAPAASAAPERPSVTAAAADASRADASAARTSVYIWATNVNVRHDGADADCVFHPSRASCPTVVATVSRTTAKGHCQRVGETIHDSGYSNRWWTLVELADGKIGWVSNIYIQGGEKIAGVPDCAW